uniref:Piwi domain-containing protein n=1 Tax=Caenorhabditis tropicalis TaxID=1561998 RepID=A0A1I7UM53_9PELO
MSTGLETQLESLSVSEPQKKENAERKKTEEMKLGLKPLAEKQKPAKEEGRLVNIETNIRKISVDPNQRLYQYSVSIYFVLNREDGSEMVLEMSKSTRRAEEHEQDKERCRDVYEKAVEQFVELREGGPFFYDCQSTLWALSKIPSEELEFSVTEVVCTRRNFIRADFLLKAVESVEISTSDILRTASRCPGLADRRLLDSLAIIISEEPHSRQNVMTDGNAIHYMINDGVGIRSLQFPEGNLSSSVGAAKSLRLLDGSNDTPGLFMTTEMKTSLFHPTDEPLISVLKTFQGFHLTLSKDTETARRITEAMKGMILYLNYGPFVGLGRDGVIVKLTGFGLPPHEQTFTVGGERVSLYDYFWRKYGIRIESDQLMTVETVNKSGRKDYFPPELLLVYRHQKVTGERMINNESRDLIKLAAAPPHVRRETTDRVVEEVGLSSSRTECISISNPTTTTGRVLEPARKYFGNEENPRSFFDPMSLKNWVIVFYEGEAVRGIDRILVEEMRKNGMVVAPPIIDCIPRGQLDPVFIQAKQAQIELIVFITKKFYDIHDWIKAKEQEYDVLTQEIHFETAQKVLRGKKDTLQGIVNKTNMKLGGLNYFVQSKHLPVDCFVLGFSHSQKSYSDSNIATIGFSSNSMNHSHKFAGGYVFVKRSKDLFGGVISDVLRKTLKAMKKNREKPSKVVIYFHGLADSQIALANEVYSQKCLDCFSSLKSTYTPELTIIASTKSHNERLYASENGRIQNLEPGTVVDTGIVSPVFNEFYHAGATTWQGTTKTTKYTVVYSSEVVDLQKIESLTNDLCQDHQIVFTPTSLPTPIYVATESAERGNKILRIKNGPILKENGEIDIDGTNEQYGYKNKAIGETRFNA